MAQAKWTVPSTYSSGNLADNSCLASRAANAAFYATIGGVTVTVDNSSGLALYMDVELQLGALSAVNWGVNDHVDLYLMPSLDGTNFVYDTGTFPPPVDYLVGSLLVTTTAETTARRLIKRGIVLPPAKFKVGITNKTSQTFAATGNALSYVTYNEQVA